VTALHLPSVVEGFDVVGVSVGAALVSGALSLAAPDLAALTESLAALALAGWFLLARAASGSLRRMFAGPSAVALASVGAGMGLFLLGGGILAPFKGLVEALLLVPLWAVARRLPREGS
jgi:CHASE2 domain-containing sensor protein